MYNIKSISYTYFIRFIQYYNHKMYMCHLILVAKYDKTSTNERRALLDEKSLLFYWVA